MKLTPDNLDYEDCRPVRRVDSIKLPPYLQKIRDEADARQATGRKVEEGAARRREASTK